MLKKGSLTALLLFGMFFGAGNLTFPPQLGFESGGHFWPAIAGFVLSGVGIAILTLVIGTLNPKGYIHEISQKISPKFALVYLAVLYLSIGPFFAIPRTAATAFSIGFSPLIGSGHTSLWLFVFTVIYFALALWIAMNPSKILDSIGRILTPIFAIMIVVVIVAGAFKYGGHNPQDASQAYQASAFGKGFLEGYNTLDAMASVAFSVVAVVTLNQLGFKSKKEYISTIWVVGFVVTLLFGALYLGLAFLGNHFPLQVAGLPKDANIGASVLSQATQAIFGTAGLIVATGEFFHKAFPKVSYKAYAIIFTLIGFAIANLGLNNIIAFSVPVLLILYPITITIVMIVIANKFVALSKPGMQVTVAVVTLIALLSVIGSQFKLAGLNALINFLPLSRASLPWLIPAILCILLSLILPDKIKSESFEME